MSLPSTAPAASGSAPATVAAEQELSGLAEAGRLIAEYPRVCRVVAGLDGDTLARAGRLLARLDPDEIHRAHPELPVVTIAVTGHGTVAAVVPALTAELARHGLVARTVLSGFDSYVTDLLDPGSALHAARPDIVCCLLDPEVVFDELPAPWRIADVARTAAEKTAALSRLASAFAAAGHGTLVLNTLPLLRRHTHQLVDHRSRAELGAVWRETNAGLLRLGAEHPALVVLDLEPLITAGVPVRDDRLSAYAGAHLGTELLAGYAREIGHLARQLTGRTKKVLVVDLDETLWGGVLGDDGIEGIEVGEGRRGPAFADFQRVVGQLADQGVLVAAVSKNEPETVARALREHPRMVLREESFVQVVANWEPKHENLGRLADRLGLAVDSFVFADDSAYERELVRRELPGVAVVDLDTEPAWHVRRLLADGWFDTREVTRDDRLRLSRYQVEAARRGFLDSFSSLTDYLRELGVWARLERVTGPAVARVAQLTQRTNQFNLTARRLQPRDVAALSADPAALPLAIHAGDRFGEHGLIGAILARRDGDRLMLDNFLLSCRVFARGIEDACLLSLLAYARDSGATSAVAEYRPTGRNTRVAPFYPGHGFVPIGEADGVQTFRHDLGDIAEPPAHVRLDAAFPPVPERAPAS